MDYTGPERRGDNMADINRELGEIKTLLEHLRDEIKELKQGRRDDYTYLDDKIERKVAEIMATARAELQGARASIEHDGGREFEKVTTIATEALELAREAFKKVQALEEQHETERKLTEAKAKTPWGKFLSMLQTDIFRAINTLALAFIAYQVFEWVRTL